MDTLWNVFFIIVCIHQYISLSVFDFLNQKAGSTSVLLSTLKKLILNFWIEDVKEIDNLRLQLALRMLKSPHFNARMNSLKEVKPQLYT